MGIWLARLAVDRWRHSHGVAPGQGADGEAHALITETAHGPRIDDANEAGRAAGAATGMMLADARTLCPQLKAVPSDPAGDLALLERLALWAGRWGPQSALDGHDGLLVDVTAVAHLFGGEQHLLADVAGRFADWGEGRCGGLAARAAIAPTAGAAWALAHFAGNGSVLAHAASAQGGPDRVRGLRAIPSHFAKRGGLPRDLVARNDAHTHIERALAEFPVAALRLDADVLLVLKRLGLKRIGDLAGIIGETRGRDALQRRFRTRSPAANPLIRLDQLSGRLPEPLLPVIAHPPPMTERRLMEPIRHRDLLDRVLADLAQDMARELETRGEGARRLECGLWRVDGEVVVRRLEMAAASRDPAHICRLFAARLDDVDAGFGIEIVRLRAPWTEPLGLVQSDIEAAAEDRGTSLAACIDRLVVRLGEKAVRRPVAHSSHLPERAQRWQAPLGGGGFDPQPASQEQLAFHARPLKMLDRPEKIAVLYATPDGYPQRFRWRGEVHEVARVEGPERIAPEWWREKSTARLRDYYRIEDARGRRYWIYRAGLVGDGRGGLPDWFLQGLCA